MDQNTSRPTLPPDYLDKIAPQPPNSAWRPRSKRDLIILIGIGAGILLIILIMLLGSLSSNRSTQEMAARLSTVDSVLADSTQKTTDPELRAINSNLKIYMTNTLRDIDTHLTHEDFTINTIDEKITAEEPLNPTLERLEDARLNGVYDRTYAREMAYLLETLLIKIKTTFESTSDENFKQFLKDLHANLSPIKDQLSEFNSSA